MPELKFAPSKGAEDTQMEGIALFPDGHPPLKKYLEGEQVEVRQREKGLRGSWFPGVVIAVKQGKRIVEYDELLTEDGRKKLIESVRVGRSAEGVRTFLRSSLKPALSRTRSLIRPRPPPTQESAKLSWKTGLWVDCYHKDAWWEGILKEDICSSRKRKRVCVFFPEEDDSQSISLKDMRVGQDWNEDLGRWIPRGYADAPVTRSEKQVTMSVGRESRILQRCSAGEMNLELASEISKPPEIHTSPCSVVDKAPSADPEPSKSDRHNGLEPETHDSASEELLSNVEDKCAANLGSSGTAELNAQDPEGVHEDVSTELAIVSVSGNKWPDCDIDIRDLDDNSARELLTREGWNISQNIRKTGKAQWYYRAPGGTLLGSLPAAINFWERHSREVKEEIERLGKEEGEDENPTLHELTSDTLALQEINEPENRMQIVTPKNGKSVVVIPAEAAVDNPVLVNGFMGQMSLTALLASCVSGRPPLRMRGQVDHSDWRIPKRSASEMGELDQGRILGEQKRRKITSGITQQCNVQLIEENESTPRPREWIGREEDANMTDVKIVSLTSKKRVSTAEEIANDPSIFRAECITTPGGPKTKKSRAITTDVVSPPEGKGRKSIITLQESLQNQQTDSKPRKKPFSPLRATDVKQGKKVFTPHSKQVKKSAKKSKKSRAPPRAGFRLEVLLSAPSGKDGRSAETENLLKKRTLLSWLIDNGMVEENDRVRYLNRKDNHCMLEGYVTRDGIRCDCCGNIVTLSVFEAHAGSKLHRPSANIFLSSGKSLSECQVELLARKNDNASTEQKASDDQESADKSDDTCGICGDGGQLICCDHCPSTFHLECMGMEAVPEGDWFCPNCRCAICGGSQFNGDKSSFGDLTVIFCDQCECEYHVKCLRDRGVELDSCPQEDWFCGESCQKIFRGLRGLVGVSRPMEGGFSWTLLRSQAEDDRKSGCVSNTELNAEHDSKLSIALSVMQECFRPMIDPRTKIDIVSHVLYNRRSDVSRLNYHGFYTMLLERGDELISVATIRVHGSRLAEMPLIGTRFAYRRQGMCRRLMSALEEMLRSLGVERLVLPAVPELLETWTGAFGFMGMQGSERLKLMDLNIMAFPGTSLLYKPLDKLDVPRIGVLAGGIRETMTMLPSGQPMKISSGSKFPKKSVQTAKKRGRPPKYKETGGEVAGVSEYAEYSLEPTGEDFTSDLLLLENVVARTPFEDDRKKLVCPAEARKKRGHFARPRKGNLFGNFLSQYSNKKGSAEKTVPNAVTVPIEQVARFGEDASGVLYRPASPTGSVPVECISNERDSSALQTISPEFRLTDANEGGADVNEAIPQGEDDPLRKGESMELLNSVSDLDPQEGPAPEQQPQREDVGVVSHGRSTSEANQSVELDEELDDALAIRNGTHPNEVKSPEWLSCREAVSNPAPGLTQENADDTHDGPERQFQHRVPPLETATVCSTKTYERRRSKLSPLAQKDPLTRHRPLELADTDPISRTLDFTSEELESAVQYVELQPVTVPMKIFPSQFSCQYPSIMPVGTLSPVQIEVVNRRFRGESSLPDRSHSGTAGGEDTSGSSHDQGDGHVSRGTGLMVRLKLNLKAEKKTKKKKPKDLPYVPLPMVPECNILPNGIQNFSKQGASCSGLDARSRDREVTSPEPRIQGQSEKRERVMEPQYISVMVN
ncbi:hypothetical protein R1sor_024569 [Riccia sorocarpa]|uniref:Histone acetyltransferase n=1 Tax=Riccia sorocarpa TaxID=122646 RepID=A0ABD3GR16_9MARC